MCDREPNSDLTVELSNATGNGAGGRGKVRFATYAKTPVEWPDTWPANTTATQATITRTLPKAEDWVSFVVAWEYGKPSDGLNGTNGRDTTIEARAGGDLVGSHDVMVRVRKNVGSLAAGERTRFADTVKALHTKKGYQVLQDMHRDGWFLLVRRRRLHPQQPRVHHLAPGADPPLRARAPGHQPGGDAAVGNSDDAVPASLFSEGFMGAIEPKTCAKMCASGADGGKLCDVTSVTECTANGYHSNHDRIWARWQVAHRGAGTATEYAPQGAFAAANGVSRMAYLDGTFWPWNDLTSKNGNCTNAGCPPATPLCCSNTMVACTVVKNESSECPEFPSGWPTTAPGGAAGFPPPAGGAKLGPGKTPKVSDVINYEGRVDPTKGLGYCYDDTAY